MIFHLLVLLLSISTCYVSCITDFPAFEHNRTTTISSLPGQPTTIQPIFSPDNGMHVLVRLIQGAQSTIDVQNQYFSKFTSTRDWLLSSTATTTTTTNPRPQDIHPLVAALYLANKRGVRVRVSLPACAPGYVYGSSSCKSPDTYNVTSFFQSVGIQVKLLSNANVYIHNKGWVIDQQTVVISSINLSKTSLRQNRESGVVITDARIAAWFGSEFQADWENSIDVSYSTGTPSFQDPNLATIMSLYTEIPHPAVSVYADFTLFASNSVKQYMTYQHFQNICAATTKVFHGEMYQLSSVTLMKPITDMIDASPNMDASIIVSKTLEGGSANPDDPTSTNNNDNGPRIALLVNNVLSSNTPAPAHVWTSSGNFTYQHAKFWLTDGINTTVFSGNWAGTSMPNPTTNQHNREWGITITSSCINAIFQRVWSADLSIASSFIPPTATSSQTSPNNCNFDACGNCVPQGVTSTCMDVTTACTNGQSSNGGGANGGNGGNSNGGAANGGSSNGGNNNGGGGSTNSNTTSTTGSTTPPPTTGTGSSTGLKCLNPKDCQGGLPSSSTSSTFSLISFGIIVMVYLPL